MRNRAGRDSEGWDKMDDRVDEVIGGTFLLFCGCMLWWYLPIVFYMLLVSLAGAYALVTLSHRDSKTKRQASRDD